MEFGSVIITHTNKDTQFGMEIGSFALFLLVKLVNGKE